MHDIGALFGGEKRSRIWEIDDNYIQGKCHRATDRILLCLPKYAMIPTTTVAHPSMI